MTSISFMLIAVISGWHFGKRYDNPVLGAVLSLPIAFGLYIVMHMILALAALQ